MSWNIVSKYKLLCTVGEEYIYYHKGNIYVQKLTDIKTQKLLCLPTQLWKRLLVKNRLFERLLRLEPRVAIALSETEFLLSYQGKIFCVNIEKRTFCVEHKYRAGMNNPLSFCTFENRILYGEYFGNINHEEVCIYERNPQGVWGKRFSFPTETVGHIHQIVYDRYRKCLWILTGDSDLEAGIWKSDMSFRNVESVFSGHQKYRSCFLTAHPKGILYATDTPLEENAVYFSREADDGSFLEPELIYEMKGPCIYGKVLDDDVVAMATSVEPDASLPINRYRVTMKLGKGVKDRYSHLVIGNNEKGFQELCKFKKDVYGMWLFQFGNLQFPNVLIQNELIITGQALSGLDGKTLQIDVPK